MSIQLLVFLDSKVYRVATGDLSCSLNYKVKYHIATCLKPSPLNYHATCHTGTSEIIFTLNYKILCFNMLASSAFYFQPSIDVMDALRNRSIEVILYNI